MASGCKAPRQGARVPRYPAEQLRIFTYDQYLQEPFISVLVRTSFSFLRQSAPIQIPVQIPGHSVELL